MTGTVALGAPATAPSFARSLPSLMILSLAMAAGFAMMGSFSMVQEAAKAEMGLSDFELSLVQGVSAAVPMLLFSIPIGLMVDRVNRLRLFMGLALLWTLGTLMTAMVQSVPMLFLARMLAAVGTTGALTAALSLAADLCVPEQRGRALLIPTLGKTLGQGAAVTLSGWLLGLFLASQSGWFGGATAWRATHYTLAIVSLALSLPLLLLREPARREVSAGLHAPWRVVMAQLWARRAFLGPLFIGQVSVVMADAAAAIWAPPVLSRSYGIPPESFAGWMGVLVFGTGVAGTILGAGAADLGMKRAGPAGLMLGAVVAAALGIGGALFPVMPSVPLFGAMLGLLMLCGTVTGLVTSVALTVMLPNEVRGLAIGIFITIAGLIGFGIAPVLVTAISGMLGGEKHLGEGLAMVGAVVSFISVFAFWLAMRRAGKAI